MNNFNADYLRGKEGEDIVSKIITQLTQDYIIYPVTDLHEQYYGDYKLIDRLSNDEVYIEVKRDDFIAKTGNFYLEEWQYFEQYDKPGFMYHPYQFLIFVSMQNKMLYVIDFTALRDNYKRSHTHEYPRSGYGREYYLCDEYQLRKWKALMYKIDYNDETHLKVYDYTGCYK